MKARGFSQEAAALASWHLGMATMVLMGLIKVALSFAGGWIQKAVPAAGLLGSLAGVGLALIGFILTGMLWGGAAAQLIDGKLKTASLYLWILAAGAFFGVVHSAMPEGNLYRPWTLANPARQVPYQFCAGYAALALAALAASFRQRESIRESR